MGRDRTRFAGHRHRLALRCAAIRGSLRWNGRRTWWLGSDPLSTAQRPAIAAPSSLRLFVDGKGGHAGAVLMPERRDALCAAAEITLAVERATKSTGAIDTVGTTGVCDVFPGAVNSIPSRVRLELDIRDT